MTSSFLLPFISKGGWRPAAERTFQHQGPDGLLDQAENKDDDNEPQQQACVVCAKHVARYTCPKCQIPYCSVDCYRNHSNDIEGDNDSTSQCTEMFYKNRVQSLLRLETLEQTKNTQTMLHQHFENTIRNQENGGGDDDEAMLLQENELYDLLERLEVHEDDDLTYDDLVKYMSPELRAKFQRDLQNENVVQELNQMILEPWHPWWRRELVVGANNHVDGDNADERAPSVLPETTLDERLLQVPKFDTLMKTKSSENPQLLFNLMEIIYSICWTLRLYHGCQNATKEKTADRSSSKKYSSLSVEVAVSLLSACKVLSQDARYASKEEVLSDCTASSTRHYQHYYSSGGGVPSLLDCHVEWDVLVEDVALVLTSHRLVGRALLEAMDIFKAAIKHMSHQSKKDKKKVTRHPSDKDSSAGHPDEEAENTMKANLSNLRKARKKMEFYLSWSQQQHQSPLFGDHLKNDMLAWAESWRLDVSHASDDKNKLEMLQVVQHPEDQAKPRTNATGHPETARTPLVLEVLDEHYEDKNNGSRIIELD